MPTWPGSAAALPIRAPSIGAAPKLARRGLAWCIVKIREAPLRPLRINIDINHHQSLLQKKTDTGTRARLGAENVSDVSSYNLGECGARGRGLRAESVPSVES